MRRFRWLRSQNALCVRFVVGADAVAHLVALGWLDPEKRGDRDAVAGAVIGVAARGLALRVTPGSKGE